MQECWPSFRHQFECKKGMCSHTCCAGWQIDVDEESAYRYLTYKGEIGQIMKDYLVENETGYQLLLNTKRRCPLLNDDGLCRLILEKGEKALCRICAEHPRFYSKKKELLLCGYGLSCEAVCDLLLDDAVDLMFEVSGINERMSFPQLMEFGHFYCPDSVFSQHYEKGAFSQFVELMQKTECSDMNWRQMLLNIHERDESKAYRISIEKEKLLNKVYQYILYRLAEHLDRENGKTVCGFAKMSTVLIDLLSSECGTLKETVRFWSEQIEYSTQNVSYLLDAYVC